MRESTKNKIMRLAERVFEREFGNKFLIKMKSKGIAVRSDSYNEDELERSFWNEEAQGFMSYKEHVDIGRIYNSLEEGYKFNSFFESDLCKFNIRVKIRELNKINKYKSDGLSIENFDEATGYRRNDTIDGITIEKVIDLTTSETVLFMKIDRTTNSEYQFLIADGKWLTFSTAPFASLEDAIAGYKEASK